MPGDDNIVRACGEVRLVQIGLGAVTTSGFRSEHTVAGGAMEEGLPDGELGAHSRVSGVVRRWLVEGRRVVEGGNGVVATG